MGLFTKKPLSCAVCGRDLKHRYKPQDEWKIEGYLCSDCHIEKMKEFSTRPKEPNTCAICKEQLGDIAVRPRWELEMEFGSLL